MMYRGFMLLVFGMALGLMTGWSQDRGLVSVTADQSSICLGESVDLHASYNPFTPDPITYTFEDGMQGWTTIDADGHGNAWERTNSYQAHGGSYQMYAKYNFLYAHQDYLVSPQITLGVGKISFYAKRYSSSWEDTFRVYLSTSGNSSASNFSIELTSGNVLPGTTFAKYEYDLSPYQGQGYVAIVYTAAPDQFYLFVDDVTIYDDGSSTSGDMTYNFENGTLQGWTTIDADGDGYNWTANSYFGGHNGSEGIVFSQSYYSSYYYGAFPLTPDNYLVSPFKLNVKPGAYISFWACNQDVSYEGFHGEHFGVAVSTTNNTSASAFTTIQEWTLAAKETGRFTNTTRSGSRKQGNWHLFTVDLSDYVGQNIWVALRHFNCTDEFYIDVDDITLYQGTDDDPGGDDDDEVTYHWSNGMTGQDITVSPTTTTIYTVTVIHDGNPIGSAQKTIVVYSDPELVVSTNTGGTTVCLDDSITLYATISEPNYVLVGDILCTDGSTVSPSDWPCGKTAKGIVFYVDASSHHGWAIDLNRSSEKKKWSTKNEMISGLSPFSHWLDAMSDLDGYSNTQRIRNFGNQNDYPAAWAVDLDHGWYLPAIGQLNIFYGVIFVVNASLELVGGTPVPMENINSPLVEDLWSSTTSTLNNYAMFIRPHLGKVGFDTKSKTYFVRAVIDF